MTQAHVKFPENVVRPPDDYSDLEESYVLQHEAVIPVSPSLTQDVLGESYVLQHEAVSPSPSLTEDFLQHEVVSPDSPSPSLIQDVLQHEIVSPPSTWMMFDHKGETTNNQSEGM